MLRALLMVAVPITTLVAGSQAPYKSMYEACGQDAKVVLAQVPIEKNMERIKAVELAKLRAAAEEGDLDCQAKLGVMYYWGEGAPQDWNQARLWLGKASERGHMDAQAKLGAMYFLGQGGPRDLEASLKWFRAAAAQGEAYAEGCMGVMYAVGEGVHKDLLEAYVWLLLAQAGGDTDAAEPFQQVKSHLTPAQIEEGDRRVSETLKSREHN